MKENKLNKVQEKENKSRKLQNKKQKKRITTQDIKNTKKTNIY